MSGSRRIPWDLIESVGQELKVTSSAVYMRWMAHREAESHENIRLGAPQISIVRGICLHGTAKFGATAQGHDAFDPRRPPSQSKCRGDGCRVASFARPVPLASQLGASAHSSGYFSPRPPTISQHKRRALQSATRRKAASARAAHQARTSMTSWEGRRARRQARRAELLQMFPHLQAAAPERQVLAIQGTSGRSNSSTSILPALPNSGILSNQISQQPQTCD